MANISKINGVAIASVSKLSGRTLANGDKVMGIVKPSSGGTAHTFLTKVSDWNNTNTGYGLGDVPGINVNTDLNWRTNTSDTAFGSTTANRQWTSDAGFTTPSSGTGPSDGHDSSQGIDGDGRESSGSDYVYTEASGQFNKIFLLRSPKLDFSSALSNSTLKLYFWFHMFGSNMGNLGVSATDNSTSAGDDTLGKHFTGDTTGGLTITFWDDNSDDGSSTSSAVRITGQQQTAGAGSTSVDAHWRLAAVDLNDLAGQSEVYLWFYSKSGANFRSDVCIDDVEVVGEV
tara:strand:+ start:225 stop:1085 length:861 start_codon:yes stop_codon:yes gene_type:complete